MQIRRANEKDLNTVVQMALLLWPEQDFCALKNEFAGYIQSSRMAVFLAEDAHQACGFAQFSRRSDYVEGTDSSPVGYLEGIFVPTEHRRKGVAKQLVQKGEAWAKQNGCAWFASDCLLENHESIAFHLGYGFREAQRIVCFSKKLEENDG